MTIPFDIGSLTGKVNSIEKLKPTGMIGKIKKPITAMFMSNIIIFSVGRVIKMNSADNIVPKHTNLRTSRYFWYLSNRKPKKNDPMSPLMIKVAPMILESAASNLYGDTIGLRSAPRLV